MKSDLNKLVSRAKKIQNQAKALVKDMDLSSQIKGMANKYQADVKTILQADRKAVEKGLHKARVEVQKLVKLLPNVEEGQAILQNFLKKNGINLDRTVNRVGKKAARKVKVGVKSATRAVKTKVRTSSKTSK